MADENELFKNRCLELARASDGYFTYTSFLGLMEQSLLAQIRHKLRAHLTEWGGAEGCERIIVRFGDPEELGYDGGFPISVLEIRPRSEKFSEKLSHRDILGATLNLGIERDTLGDIVIRDNVSYLFCLDNIAEYIEKELTRVKNTEVVCKICDTFPEGELYTVEGVRVQLESERLDAVIAKLYHLSRADAQALIRRGLVFVSGQEIESVSHVPKQGDKISVRGYEHMRP